MSLTQAPRAPRVDIRLEVAVGVAGSGVKVRSTALNISETGVLIRSSRRAPVGTILDLNFKGFSVEAVVIWAKPTDEGLLIGLKFVSARRRARAAIQRIVTAGSEVLEPDDSERQPEGRRIRFPRASETIGAVAVAAALTTAAVMSGGRAELDDDGLAQDLRRTVAVVVVGVEAFRAREGRLPDVAELVAEGLVDPLVDQEMEYEVNAQGYVLRLTQDSLVAEYDGRIPLDRWIDGGWGVQ